MSAQIGNLIRRATKRLFVLRYYSSFMPGDDLKKLYCSLIRSVLEYSSVTYHSMLTKGQENELEKVQKKALRCMYGYNKSYSELLTESGLQPLKSRRETAAARKASENPIYARWFKKYPNHTTQRNPKLFLESFARTNRLYNSPLFAMRRALNNSPDDSRPESGYLDLAYLFDDI